jgi:glyoxylase-like metal-dependent hydrolase (beta-lactamase superfamily II)
VADIGIIQVTPAVTHLALRPPVPGYEGFIGAYVCRGEKTAIVDPGPAVAIPNLLRALEEMALAPAEVDYLVLTHIHQDHAGGAGAVLREMPNARVIVHGRGWRHIVDPRQLWEGSRQALGELAMQYGEIEPVPDDRIIAAEDLMDIDLGRGVVLQVHMTPGHAAHHLSLFDEPAAVPAGGHPGVSRPADGPSSAASVLRAPWMQ